MTALRRLTSRALAALALCLALLFALSAAQAQTVTSQRPTTFALANGLAVVIIPDHRTPVVTQMIWYKVGSADETPGKSGLAHFLEHLMFKGTEKHPAGEFSQTVLRVGGDENAYTSFDYTGYYQRVPRDQIDRERAERHEQPARRPVATRLGDGPRRHHAAIRHRERLERAGHPLSLRP